MLTPRAPSLALLLAFLAVFTWSSALVGISFALRELPPGPMVLLRFGVASTCFLMLLMKGLVQWPHRRDLPSLILISLLGHVVYQLCLSAAQTSITAGAAGVLIALVPVLSSLLAIPVLGERLQRRTWIGMTLAFGGVVLISFGGRNGITFQPMAVFGVVAATASAGYFVLQKPLLTRYSALDLTAYGVWTGTVAMLFFAPGLPRAVATASMPTLLAVVYLGVVPTALGYTLWSLALARAPASQVSSLLYLEPVVTFLLAWILLAEVPTLNDILGAICALGGVVLVNSKGRAKEAKA